LNGRIEVKKKEEGFMEAEKERKDYELRTDYESVTSDTPIISEEGEGAEDGKLEDGETEDEKKKEEGDEGVKDEGKKEEDGETEDGGQKTKTSPGARPRVPYHKQLSQVIEENRELARRIEELEGKGRQTDGKDGKKKTEAKKPVPADYESYDEYVEALTEFKAREIVGDAERGRTEKESQRKAREAEKEFYERIEKFGKEHGDFDELVINNPDLRINKTMYDALMDSPFGPDIYYFLGQNPKEAERIFGLAPIAAIREIGKIEAGFGKKEETPAGKKEEKKISKAPEPLDPVGGSKSGEKNPEKMSYPDYRAWRRGQT
jgi:hypothetical protein